MTNTQHATIALTNYNTNGELGQFKDPAAVSVDIDFRNKVAFLGGVGPGEVCQAVVYHGLVQYLTHEQRVAIIQGAGADYDAVPEDFEGPMYKEVGGKYRSVLTREVETTLIREWDGTLAAVKVERRRRWVRPGVGEIVFHMTYSDGTRHTVTSEYLDGLKKAVFDRRFEPPDPDIHPYW
jgi:hypothetical protein